MRTKSMFLAVGLCLLLLSSHAAAAQVNVRVGLGYPPPRAYYGPRYRYYPPRPAVVYVAPPPPRVVVVPAPYYAPRTYYAPPRYYAPRHYGYRGRR